MKELLKSMDQRMDDMVSKFHNSIITLLLINLLSVATFCGSIILPIFLFSGNVWMFILGVLSVLIAPISVINAVCAIRSACWHLHKTFEIRLNAWFD